MATVTAFTAERMKAIEDTTVVSGLVDVNGDLILYQRDETPINAGNVIGPPAELPDRLTTEGQEVTDWYQAIYPGFYWGISAANGPTAPDGGSGAWQMGFVTRLASQNRMLLEVREARTGVGETTVARSYYNGSTWTPWTYIIENNYRSLGNENLDTVTQSGTYIQSTVVNGTLANNYPIATGNTSVAGMLEVFNFLNGAHVYQRFTRRGDNLPQVWARTKYTSGAWQPWQLLSTIMEAWLPLQPYLATGVTYTADGAPHGSIGVRRVGQMVEMVFSYLTIDSLNVPTSGNVANKTLFNAIPEKFRPAYFAGITPGPNGGQWTGYVSANGIVALASYNPPSTATASVVYTDQTISGSAFYPAATP